MALAKVCHFKCCAKTPVENARKPSVVACPKKAGKIFSRIILHYKVPPQDVATGEAMDAFVTLWQDKMADAWYRSYR